MPDDAKPPNEPSIDELLGAPPAPEEGRANEAPREGATQMFGLKLESWMTDIAVADLLGGPSEAPAAEVPLDQVIEPQAPPHPPITPMAALPPRIAPAEDPLDPLDPLAGVAPPIDASPMPQVIFAPPIPALGPPRAPSPSRAGLVIAIAVLVLLAGAAGAWFALGQSLP